MALIAQDFRIGAEVTTKKHEFQASIYSKTRGVMKARTGQMFALALRDFQRQQHAPMKCTKLVSHQRRYSIDVNVGFEERKVKQVSFLPLCSADLPLPPTIRILTTKKLIICM